MPFYLGVVDRAADGSWGVWFPDLPGCTSSGRDLDDLFARSIEAVRLWAEDAMDEEGRVPPARMHSALVSDPDVADAITAAGRGGCIVQVPLLLDAGRTVRANISIDASLLKAIDEAADQSKLTRSAFLASAAREKIARKG